MTCPICHEPMPDTFHGRPRVTCGMTCRNKLYRQRYRGNGMARVAPLIVANLRRARKRAEADALERFGSLTAREAEIFNYANRLGYDRGYFVGRYQRVHAA